MAIRLLVIEDHPVTISGIKSLLENDIEIVENSITLKGSLNFDQSKFDIILLDLLIGENNPVQNVKLLKNKYPNTPIVIFSCEDSVIWKRKMFDAGVSAYIVKTSDKSEIKLALDNVFNNKNNIAFNKNYEYYFKLLLDNMSEGVAIHQLIFDENNKPVDYIIIDVNKSYETILGLKNSDVKGKLASVVYGNVPALKEYSDVVINQNPTKFKFYYPTNKRFYDISVSPWNDIGFISLFTDITETVLLEKNYSNIFENATIGIFQIKDGVFLTVNTAFANILGYEKEELIDHKSVDFFYDKKNREKLYDELIKHGYVENFVTQEVKKNGEVIWVSINIKQIKDFDDNLVYNEGIMQEITTQKSIEKKLKYNRERLEESQKIARIGNWEANIDTGELYWSNIIYDIFGLDKKTFEPSVKAFHSMAHPDDLQKIFDSEKNSETTGFHDVVHRVILPNKEIRFVHELGIRNGNILRGTVQDITKIKKSEDLLNISEIRYRRLFESAKDGILILDAENGKIVDVNPYLVGMLGYTREQFIEKSIWEIGTFKDIIANKEKFLELQKNEYVRYENLPLETYNGNKKYVEFVSNVYLVNSHNVIQCNIRDITESKILQSLSNEISSILNNDINLKEMIIDVINSIQAKLKFSAVGIRFKNGDDFPYFAQNGFSDDFLFTENSILSKNKNNGICRDEKGNPILECACGLVISGKLNKENPLLTTGGSAWSNNLKSESENLLYHQRNECLKHGYGSMALIPIKGNKIIIGILQLNSNEIDIFSEKMIEFFEGIGEIIGVTLMRKQAENELLKAKEKAEQSDKMKLEYLSNMSHDLRTPMNAIIGFSDLLRTNNLTKNEKTDYINTIINNGKFLMTLIDDIIDISKIDSNSLKIENRDFELNRLMEELRLTYSKQIKDKNIDIIIDIDINKNIILNTDKYRLKQILTNLIGNAIKFTKTGYVKFGYDILTDNKLNIYVQDTGIGIDKSNYKIIFERFKQLNESGNKFKGAGIGLSITKSLIELLGFDEIKIDSELDKGSKFYFNVPFKIKHFDYINEIREVIKHKNKKINFNNKRILIVEDDYDSIRIIKSYLNNTNCQILECQDGNLVIDLFKNEKPDLILLDIGLPGKNGYDILKEIRELDDRIPIIVESALAMPDQKTKAYNLGCDDFLTKPYNKEDFLNKIDNLI